MADGQGQDGIGQTINEITERATLIVREEIELAKAEIEQKVKSLVRGAVIAGAAGFFALMGLVLLLHGFAWVFYGNVFPSGADNIFWGFLLVAGILFLLGGLAGWLAARMFKAGAPPTPDMAIDEAKLIRETVEASSGLGDEGPRPAPAGTPAAATTGDAATSGATGGGAVAAGDQGRQEGSS